MPFIDAKNTLFEITELLEKKKKFTYTNISKGSIISLNKNSENPFPKPFAKNVINAINYQDSSFHKAVSHSLVSEIVASKHNKIGLTDDATYYYSNIFEYYQMNDRDMFNIILSRYFKHSPALVVSLNDKKIVQKVFGKNVHVINVNFSNMYEKVDSVYGQISEFEGGVDHCIMDCGILGLALAPKVHERLDISVIDFGKTITHIKSSFNRRKSYEKSQA
jgi:hypothetical protein